MIRGFVNYSLANKLLVLVIGAMLLGWGAVSFKNLPVEAYPDVANNYVQVITQWPGRAGEEVEQQVTIPIEVQMPAFHKWQISARFRNLVYRL